MIPINMLLSALGWMILVVQILITLEFLIGNRCIQSLQKIVLPESDQFQFPSLSILIPARNEALHIESALTSVLQLDYPLFEVWVINDRSEDATGKILQRMGQQYPQLQIKTIDELPSGWLGKNYALYQGVQHAQGELLLFTDADIHMEPSLLKRAVYKLETQQLDHLAIMPDLIGRSLGLRALMNAFTIFFCLYARPWRARNPKSNCHIGIGAFNLIRQSVYQAIGTHQPIALCTDDDMKLGKLIKRAGFRQDIASGAGLIRVAWYGSIGEMITGLMKNAFSGLNYRVDYAVFVVISQFMGILWPIIAVFLTHGLTQWVYIACCVFVQLLCFDHARTHRASLWSGLYFPVSTLLMIYIIMRSTALTLWQRGVYWRGTFYSLDALRAGQV